ncbi:MAG: hypothetical protein KatS3mg115_1067 [Candidatus Poribacteria bacterium]|nr:MAG: hypothetical protein KatS3mg115_1067 [Candidatus Poribacteria bacterium]
MSGLCVVEASRDGQEWVEVGRLSGTASERFSLPATLFPAQEVWVRIRGQAEGDNPVNFQVHRYHYRAQLTGSPPEGVGETYFFEEEVVAEGAPRVAVAVRRPTPEQGTVALLAELRWTQPLEGRSIRIQSRLDEGEWQDHTDALRADERLGSLLLPIRSGGDHTIQLRVLEGEGVVYLGSTNLFVPLPVRGRLRLSDRFRRGARFVVV